MDLAKIRELSGQLSGAATDADRDWPGSVGVQSADALNYAADEIERLEKSVRVLAAGEEKLATRVRELNSEIERLREVARLGWQLVWSEAILGGFGAVSKSDGESAAKDRLAQADAALKSIRPVSDLSSQAQPPIYICPGTRPCPGSGVRRVARDCPNCGQPCIPHPAFDTQAVPR